MMNMNKKNKLKIIVLFVSLITVFAIYKCLSYKQDKINYIALGDSIAEGMNSYSIVDYGYPDYISDYLNDNNKLNFYTKLFSKSGYTTNDVINDIENNKIIEINNKRIYLKEALRESDLVTITIGANNYLRGMNLDNIDEKIINIESSKKDADKIAIEVENTLKLIKKYAKKQIIVTGYYNPLPRLANYKSEIDEIVKYFNNKISEICEELEINYVDIFNIFDSNNDLLPNPMNIHPSKEGYKMIAEAIIKMINS